MDDWRVELINLAPNVFATSSCLHVTLLVFLRLKAISKPTQYEEIYKKLCYPSIVFIWIISVGVRLIAVLAHCLKFWDFYFYYRYFNLHVFHTIPIICIVLMYAKLVWTLKKRSNEAIKEARRSVNANLKELALDKINQKMTLMVQRVVLFLVVCYVPYLIWMQYYYMEFPTRIPFKVKDYEVITMTIII